MHIKLEISAERIANMMISAMESGDPVTTAAKGGWCWGIYWHTRESAMCPIWRREIRMTPATRIVEQ